MYESFFGLSARPFELTADPRFFFETPQHREALTTLRYGLEAKKGLIVLTGEAGTGKTTVLRAAMAEQELRGARVGYVANPRLSSREFFETLAREFQLGSGVMQSKATFLYELRTMLIEQHAADRVVALVVDEAQSLPYELLEEIRLLANTETACTRLLQVVLSGQPEFAGRLNEPELRQLKQRVALRSELTPLSHQQTAAFIAGRLRIAGAEPRAVFTPNAVQAIHRLSRGIPRWINVLGDNALLTAFAHGVKPLDEQVVFEVARDFDLEAPAPEPRAPEAQAAARDFEAPAAPLDLLFQPVAKRRRLSFLFG